MIGTILGMMGLRVKPSALREIIEEIDEDGSGNRIVVILMLSGFWPLLATLKHRLPRIWRVLPVKCKVFGRRRRGKYEERVEGSIQNLR